MNSKTLLIGVDGATFTILDPLLDQGVMPYLKSLVDSGVRAELRSVIPFITPPAWTSLLTGRSPGNHGIFDFFQLDAPGTKQIRLATSGDVRCESLSFIANQNDLRATLLNFPVTFPPPRLNGYVISGWMPWRQLRLGCHPEALFDQIKGLPGFNARELAMDMDLEAKATEGGEEEEYKDWITLHARRDRQWLEVFRHIHNENPTEFSAILLDGPDKIQHLCWRFLDPELWPEEPTSNEREIRDLCFAYFQQLDQVIKEFVDLVGPDTSVIIASDHGFGTTTEVFHINSWLNQLGYLNWSEDLSLDKEASTLGMNHLARHTQWIDWDRTRAYVSTPTSNGIHIVRAKEGENNGVQPDEYERFRNQLKADLDQYTDPVSGEKVIAQIWTREEAYPGGAMDLAPDLTLRLRDGGLVSILPSDTILRPRPQPAGTHRPKGVFFFRGPGGRQGVKLHELSILDVAPIVLYSLGLAIPDDLEGRVPLEIFEPSARVQRPIQVGPRLGVSQGKGPEKRVETLYDEEAEEIIMKRLKDLGYIE